jgi:hypothetical protein
MKDLNEATGGISSPVISPAVGDYSTLLQGLILLGMRQIKQQGCNACILDYVRRLAPPLHGTSSNAPRRSTATEILMACLRWVLMCSIHSMNAQLILCNGWKWKYDLDPAVCLNKEAEQAGY